MCLLSPGHDSCVKIVIIDNEPTMTNHNLHVVIPVTIFYPVRPIIIPRIISLLLSHTRSRDFHNNDSRMRISLSSVQGAGTKELILTTKGYTTQRAP